MIALNYFGLFALIFAQYLTTAVPAYLILIICLVSGANTKLPTRAVLYICAVVLYWLSVLSYATGKNIFTHILFYFGFLLPFLIIYVNRRIRIDVLINEKTIIGLCLLTIFEAVLFNSPIGQHLYFFPKGDNEITSIFGFYQRPTGIAGNASLTSVVLFFLVVLTEQIRGAIKLRTRILVLATTLVLASGAGFGLVLIYLVILAFRSRRFTKKDFAVGFAYLLIVMAAIAVALGFIVEAEKAENFKLSIDYFILMYDYKMYLVTSFLEQDASLETLLFGSQIVFDQPGTTGDNGLLGAVRYIGWIGATLVFMAPLLYPGALRRYFVPFLFFCLSFVHYMGLLTPPGQVLFACYLSSLAWTKHIAREPLGLLPNSKLRNRSGKPGGHVSVSSAR